MEPNNARREAVPPNDVGQDVLDEICIAFLCGLFIVFAMMNDYLLLVNPTCENMREFDRRYSILNTIFPRNQPTSETLGILAVIGATVAAGIKYEVFQNLYVLIVDNLTRPIEAACKFTIG